MAVYNGHCDVRVSYADARNAIEQDIPADAREQIVDALLEISATEEDRATLEAFYSIWDLVQADDSLYDGYRADLKNVGIDIKALVE